MFLDQIVASVDRRISQLKPHRASLASQLADAPRPRSLRTTLLDGSARRTMGVIAECKHRSPSKGWLTDTYDPVGLAKQYEQFGASGISVLTEPEFFAGSLGHLQAVRQAVSLPVLRKDFVRDEVQIIEARAAGADAILLIVRIFDDLRHLKTLRDVARDIGLEVLVEIHNLSELEWALAVEPDILGVNNRDLDTFETRLEFSRTISPLLPESILKISESGLRTLSDVAAVRQMGYQGILVGESLVRGGGLLKEMQQWG